MQLAIVILAAGKSTRFKSRKTKVLHELCGKPMIEWILDATDQLNPTQIIIVYGIHSEELKPHFAAGYHGQPVDFVLQEPTLGTAHALEQVVPVLRDEISHLLVLPGDAPLLEPRQLAALAPALESANADHAMLITDTPNPGDLGRVQLAENGMVAATIEAHEASPDELEITTINSGIYLFSRDVFTQLEKVRTEIGASKSKGEYYLPDVVKVAPTAAVNIPLDWPIGVNDRAQFAEAEAVLLNRLIRYWMSEGVTFQLPESTYLHHDVKLSRDVTVGPHSMITHGTTIGEGTVLLQGCYLHDCCIGADCELLHVRGLKATLEDNVRCGPYVNLRPGTVLRQGVKVGNFVETKKADIGPGSKLPHLQYIGDATLGPECNIGAGTIFCNYDGIQKLHTVLGERVFIGSNSSLQGGIEIGDNGYVAMASAITRDIPAGALGIGRARQVNKEDYVAKLRERLERRASKQAEESGGK